MRHLIWAALGAGLMVAPVHADGFFTLEVDAEFEDVALDVEDAITNRGLVIDSVSYVGQMLSRTGADLGAETELYTDARIYSFCSATLSREAMEADLLNLQYCPYNVYVFQGAEEDAPVVVGYREADVPSMQNVNGMLQQIVAEATGSQ